MIEHTKTTITNVIAREAFLQAQEGYAVELDPEMADALGAFQEDALSLQDVLEDAAIRFQEESRFQEVHHD